MSHACTLAQAEVGRRVREKCCPVGKRSTSEGAIGSPCEPMASSLFTRPVVRRYSVRPIAR